MNPALDRLSAILDGIGPCVVAFSAGVDSTLLLRVAHDRLGDRVSAVTAVSPSLPALERDEAITLARSMGVDHLLVETRELEDPDYARNDAARCYYCKRELFRVLRVIAGQAGGRAVLYGAILDDLGENRPGMSAALEAGVRAPLLEAGLTKEMVRILSRQLGLPTWSKPAMACLASRIPHQTAVTRENLALVERAEASVRALGYGQVRVRCHGTRARVELDPEGLARSETPNDREVLLRAVLGAGFDRVEIDPRGYRPGGGAAPTGARQ
jgi:pyridinium-3,5-biscarboxylic acid mononucleotide sulfurtransferase